jgi:hypothetical protein
MRCLVACPVVLRSWRPEEWQPEMSSEKYQWLLFDDFSERFNEYRSGPHVYTLQPHLRRRPCHVGTGRGEVHWIDHGWTSNVLRLIGSLRLDAISRTLLRTEWNYDAIAVVEDPEEESTHLDENDVGLNQAQRKSGFSFLVTRSPWILSDQIVSGRVEAARATVYRCGEEATKRFPLAYLSRLELRDRTSGEGNRWTAFSAGVRLDESKQPGSVQAPIASSLVV